MATDPSTYFLNHTMLRVRDPARSLDFYQRILGMTLVHQMDMPAGRFTLYLLDYTDRTEAEGAEEGAARVFKRRGVLELTHNWGTEADESFSGYHNGNQDPRGFGHIAVVVDDIQAACARFTELGVKFVKRLEDGSMKNIAFIADPDGYWVEILQVGFRG